MRFEGEENCDALRRMLENSAPLDYRNKLYAGKLHLIPFSLHFEYIIDLIDPI